MKELEIERGWGTVLIDMMLAEDLGIRPIGHYIYSIDMLRMDRRRFKRELRRVLRRGMAEQAMWWIMFWDAVRAVKVRV